MKITLPPLRDRMDDVPLLAEFIVEKEMATSGGRQVSLSAETVEMLMEHRWPGNVRELQNAIRYAFIKCQSDVIEPEHLPPRIRGAVSGSRPTTTART